MPTQTFQLIGQLGSAGSKRVARLRFNYGDGYEQAVVVGHADGQEFVTLTFNAVSDRAADNITDPEDSTSKTPMEYLQGFFMKREADGAAFNVITNRGTTLLVYLDEDEINWEYFAKQAHKITIRFRQART